MQNIKEMTTADINLRMTRSTVNTVLTKLNLKGATTYMLAARTDDAEMMRYLVKLGANPNAVGVFGFSFFAMPSRNG